MSGPWPPQHRQWCDPAACEFDPALSAEGTHLGEAATITGRGWRTSTRLAEAVPEGEGVRVLLQVTERQPDARRRLVEVVTSAVLDVDDALELAATLQRLAARAVAYGA